MKLTKQKVELLEYSNPMKHIERIARVCYKSEDKITENSASKMIKSLFNNGHYAMLEHYRFIIEVEKQVYKDLLSSTSINHFRFTDDDKYIISFNARALINSLDNTYKMIAQETRHNEQAQHVLTKNILEEIKNMIIFEYDCHELFGENRSTYERSVIPFDCNIINRKNVILCTNENAVHNWMSILITTDRGISHEIVRHREETSFAQESTRYCNYCNNKHNNEITFIDHGMANHKDYLNLLLQSEETYLDLIQQGFAPQIARGVLPTDLKTEIVMTAPMDRWSHFLNLRLFGTTGNPHPYIKEIAEMIYNIIMTSDTY